MELIEFDYPCCISTRSSKYVNREFSATYRYQVKSGRIADVVLLRDELQIRHAARCFGFQSNEVWLTWVNRWLWSFVHKYDMVRRRCELVRVRYEFILVVWSYGRRRQLVPINVVVLSISTSESGVIGLPMIPRRKFSFEKLTKSPISQC